MKQNIMKINRPSTLANPVKLILRLNHQENKSRPTMINSLRSLTALCLIALSSVTLVACGGGGGGGGASGASSGSNEITPAEFGITKVRVVPMPENFIFSWTNPSNPNATISNYIVDAIAYTAATGSARAATGKLSRGDIPYAGNNLPQDYTYTGLTNGSFYEFFATANYTDGEKSKRIRLFPGRLLAGLNTDGDGMADGQDDDDDGDGDLDDEDNCPLIPNPGQTNIDGDKLGDACDPDSDNDGILDVDDNCRLFASDNQTDTNNDGVGDVCDVDLDGVFDSLDNCPALANPNQLNSDNVADGGDACDDDDDNDLIVDANDVDADGDGLIELATAVELNAMRYNLFGTGLDLDDDGDNQAGGNATGCGNGDTITACNGYEQIADIDLNVLPDDSNGANWQSIGGSCDETFCSGVNNRNNFFEAIFNGNDYIISNMRIIAPANHAHGFFGAIQNTRLLNIHIRGGSINSSGDNTGGLIGLSGGSTEVVSSSVILNFIQGSVTGVESNIGNSIGGLVGSYNIVKIESSYAVVNEIIGGFRIGGLAGGYPNSSLRRSPSLTIDASYALIGQIPSNSLSIGGLAGNGIDSFINSAYAVVSELQGTSFVAGLLGTGALAAIDSSYAVTNNITAVDPDESGGLIGLANDVALANIIIIVNPIIPTSTTASYWDNQTLSPVDNRSLDVSKYGSGKSTSDLHANLTAEGNFPAIYTEWAKAYCNPATGEYRKTDNPSSLGDGFIRAWDLGTATEYPANACTPTFTPAQQRAAINRILAGESPVPPELR